MMMARSKTNVFDALEKIRSERSELDAKEAKLRSEAASELGKQLLDCGAETIPPAKLKQLFKLVSAKGIDAALAKLEAA
jgi:Asp-tRNA(Asn)/Glu-tRNA(Gln) amidotransferase B subunit